ncbi:hypothetical protein LMG28614_00081 [Paraburkholderia ultramafica]|uniref:Uncharacterized protein n=1 Tax=Paraburkholderia ultramafica TaxID=1544867 RepID=A0A6S7ARU3_9BURK|nr:hypothetical protein [Paraburkholderia ultramafica]CAB3775769.1 hypothetical protein LMG28614_00081 [Paraburkholderia ultramafica]
MRTLATALSIAAVAASGLAACGGNSDSNTPPASSAGTFRETVLVSDGSVAAPNIDPNLKNGSGVAFNPTGAFWVADNNTQKSTLYDGNGVVFVTRSVEFGATGTAFSIAAPKPGVA